METPPSIVLQANSWMHGLQVLRATRSQMHRACLDNSTCRQEHALYRYEQTRQSRTCPMDRTSILLRYKLVIARALCKHMLFQQKHAQEV